MKILYFASLKAKTGVGAEEVTLPASVATLADLADWLKNRGGGFAEAFADLRTVRAAINQEHAAFEAKVGDGDEVAFFPPVTGG
ncbi:MAG: molybdopterin converting factor subunit 1 [Alphaproteobacteria bacterium]|nr:molybdopterin converting factor subunit 1 [Alphaproteobacteria bacterium]